jgi:thiamine pyrophosphokinase
VQQFEKVVVVTTGADPGAVRAEAGGAAVIAADGGLDAALEAGVSPALVVGDLDSATAGGLAEAERLGIPISRHPAEKDATDLELALDAAIAHSPAIVLVIGSGGGRLDHLVAAVSGLASDRYAHAELDGILGSARVHVVRGERRLTGSAGEIITLLALHGTAEGVVTEGLRYRLHDETLEPGSSRGLSNVFTGDEACIRLSRGVLVAIRPGVEDEDR